MLAAAVVALSACTSKPSGSTSGPTSAEAGARLAADARYLLDRTRQDLNAAPYTVAEDASRGAACGSGKATRSFKATMRLPLGADLDRTLDLDTAFVSGALTPHGYHTAGQSGSDDVGRRAITEANDGARTHITVTLVARGQSLDYDLSGTTDCLRAP